MSAGGGGGVVTADGTTVVVTTASGGGSGGGVISEDHNVSGGSGSKCQLSLTPRFTQEEKEILYSLFHQHEEVIDIKFRKKQRSKFSVRDAWEQIVQEFNSHPSVSATRNLKQIQKFWLNARLRKQYPFRSLNQKNNISGGSGGSQQQLVNHTIKDEPEFQLSTDEAPEHNEQQETFEEMEIDAVGVTQLEDEAIEQHQQHQQQQHVQQQPQTATLQTQQISVDQISAEKLTLNDLLKFNNTRPREEIILQIKHPSDGSGAAQITIPSPTRITLPTLPHQQHQPQQHTMATITASGYNQQIISEIKPQQITLAQFQAQQQHQQQLAAQQQQQLVVAQQQQQQQLAAVVAQQQQQHQVKMQLQPPVATQFTGTPTFTCTTFNTIPASVAPPHSTIATTAATSSMAPPPITTTSMAVDTFEEKINYFKLKEAELRFKEEQVALEKKKIELNRAQEELKHMREIHRLKVEETKMKIRVLQEEEKVLRKNHSGVHS